MSMKTRSQAGSDNEVSDDNLPPPPENIFAHLPTEPIITSIEVNENSQAFIDALDRALLRLMGSRDDAANDDTISGLPSSGKCFAKKASFVSLEIFLLFAYERLLNNSHLMNSLRTVLF